MLNVPATGKITLPADGSSSSCKSNSKDDAITENDETVTLTAATTDAQVQQKSNEEQEQSQMIKEMIIPDVDEDKANIIIGDAGSVKTNGATLTYSCKIIKRSWIKCRSRLTTGGTAAIRWWL